VLRGPRFATHLLNPGSRRTIADLCRLYCQAPEAVPAVNEPMDLFSTSEGAVAPRAARRAYPRHCSFLVDANLLAAHVDATILVARIGVTLMML